MIGKLVSKWNNKYHIPAKLFRRNHNFTKSAPSFSRFSKYRWTLFAGASTLSSLWLSKVVFAEENKQMIESETGPIWDVFSDEAKPTKTADELNDTRNVLAPTGSPRKSFPTLVLFEMESCPYCKKIRVALDYYRIPYSCVQVTAVGKRELRTTSSKKVPVLVIDGVEYHNSFAALWKIQDFVDDSLREDQRNIPAVERKWLYKVDDRLIPLITPNIAHTLSESYQSMKYLLSVDRYSWYERLSVNLLGPFFLYVMGKKSKWSLDIQDERRELLDELNQWMEDVGDHSFLLGERPCLADLCLFAFVKTLQPFDVMTDIKSHTSIMSWFRRMEQA
ncbi:Prostaglandin E synthase 2 [Galdieria sulphuraria]|nr:Prostaglandin E synthase 2 [Galdieria sulphuraria]